MAQLEEVTVDQIKHLVSERAIQGETMSRKLVFPANHPVVHPQCSYLHRQIYLSGLYHPNTFERSILPPDGNEDWQGSDHKHQQHFRSLPHYLGRLCDHWRIGYSLCPLRSEGLSHNQQGSPKEGGHHWTQSQYYGGCSDR